MYRLLALALPSAFCILTSDLACSSRPTTPSRFPLPISQLTISGHALNVELARLPHERDRGLMYRKNLAPDSGMLFVFDATARHRFWMKNTLIPLSIAFLDTAGVITDIRDMQPLDTTTDYSPSVPVRYAIEMNSGWFNSRSILPGDTVRGLTLR